MKPEPKELHEQADFSWEMLLSSPEALHAYYATLVAVVLLLAIAAAAIVAIVYETDIAVEIAGPRIEINDEARISL